MKTRFIVKDILAPLRHLLKKMPEKNVVLILSLVVGVACGCAAVLLKSAVEFIHHGLTSWFDSQAYNFLYLIYPGIGMLIAMLFVKYVVKDNIGHGVTKVLVAVSKNESKIRPHNMWSSVAASSVTIGFGGSVGAEAPIVYTGAAIGSNVARYMGLSYKNMTILLGCGAAGAVAGIFKAPLAGVLFTLEILLFNISMSSILPLLLSTISATVVSYIFLGEALPFECTLSPFAMGNMPFYVVLGLACAGFSVYFTRMTLWLEDKIKSIQRPLVRWGLSAFCLGIQSASPIDAHVVPEAWEMPGYADPVIMAAGAFTGGSSIELSADGPIREPYAVYFQGGLTWYHAKLGILMSLQKLVDAGIVTL